MSSIRNENGNPYHGQHTSSTVQFGVHAVLEKKEQKRKTRKTQSTHKRNGKQTSHQLSAFVAYTYTIGIIVVGFTSRQQHCFSFTNPLIRKTNERDQERGRSQPI